MDDVLSGKSTFIVGLTFPAVDYIRTLYWKKRRYPGRCRITIGGQALEYELLETDGDVTVAVETEVDVYEMDVHFTL